MPRRGRRLGAADDIGQLGGNERKLDVLHAERVGDRVGDADRRRHAVALPDAFRSERRERRRRLHVKDDGIRHFDRGRQQVVGESAGQEAAVRCVGVFFIEGRAQGLREPAADLSINHSRMQDRAAIVHRHVAVDTRHQRRAIDFHAAEIENESVAKRRVDAVFLVRRCQLWRRPEHGFANRLLDVVGQGAGRPMAQPGQSRERYFVVRVSPRMHGAVFEYDIVRIGIELAGSDTRQAGCDAFGRELRSPGDRRGEAACIIA